MDERINKITRSKVYRKHEQKGVEGDSMMLLELAEVDAMHLTINKIVAGSRVVTR